MQLGTRVSPASNVRLSCSFRPASGPRLPPSARPLTSKAPSVPPFHGWRGMKKSATSNPRLKVPDYCDVEPQRDDAGNIIWPAPEAAMEQARAFIREWYDGAPLDNPPLNTADSNSAASGKKALIVPDKDADGLSSGVILYRTLTTLGLDPSLIDVHLVRKGSNIHAPLERDAMAAKEPAYVIVLDQGSVAAPPVVDSPSTKSLIIDHHLSDHFPERAEVVSACHYPPVSTSSLLTYEICKTLAPSVASDCGYLACIGTHGDLGNTLKWSPPFPDMRETLKTYTKKAINDAVSLLNAPRRTSKYDVISAWTALLASKDPKELLSNDRLQSARAEISSEVELNTHTPPKFSADGRIAVLRIDTPAQVHPVIATRWSGYLNSKLLEIVLCANSGYLPGMVNFSCRIARCARSKNPPVNIIESLKAAADLSTDGLRDRLGESFARGHKEASGGIVPVEAFEELMSLLKVGEKSAKTADADERKPKKAKTIDKSPQKNTLANYFQKP